MQLAKIKKKFIEHEKTFEQLYDDTIDDIPVRNKRLKDALSSQVELQIQWGMLSKSISYLYDLCEIEVESHYSEAMTKELKDSYKTVTISEAREFSKANAGYQDAKKTLVEIKYLRDQAREVLDVITSRKYILNNITDAVTASAEGHLI